MNILIYVLLSPFLLALYPLWLMYLAVMNLQRAYKAETLTETAYYLGLPLLGFGYLYDFLMNVLVMTPVMLELPQEWLVTARVSRHQKAGSGYRYRIAHWMCKHLLDPFDPSGCHCK
jgi:hypothetical protein